MFHSISRFVSVLLAAFLVAGLPALIFAAPKCMDDDPNYPATYYHGNYREYVDLSSCDWNAENDDYDLYTAGYVGYVLSPDGDSRTYKTRTFRQAKNETAPPQFLNTATKEWVSFPEYDRVAIQQYKKYNGYLGYIENYHAFEYFMFKAVYRETRGEEFEDRLEGEIP